MFCYRVQEHRAKRTLLGLPVNKTKKTIDEQEKLRKYNRIMQRKCRKRKNIEMREKVKKYDRERHAVRKVGKDTFEANDGTLLRVMTNESIRKASWKVRKTLPKSPRKCIQVLDHITNTLRKSPRKRKIMTETSTEKKIKTTKEGRKVKRDLKDMKKNVKQHVKYVNNLKVKYSSLRKASSMLGIRWCSLQRLCSWTELESESKSKIDDTYIRPDISIELPEGKYAGNRYLNQTLKQVYKTYQMETKTKPYSFSYFARNRPKKVKCVGKTPKRQCICEKCANTVLLAGPIAASGIAGVSTDVRALVKATMCVVPHHEENNLKCVNRECEKCGTKTFIRKLMKQCPHKNLTWRRWQAVGVKRELVLVTINGTLKNALIALGEDLENMSLHMFNANWHSQQFVSLRNNFPQGTMVQVLDFGKNYLCEFQDEPQAKFWQRNQVTIHPIVAYYHCACGDVIKDETIFITDDLHHDSYAVSAFEQILMKHIKKQSPHEINHVIQMSDQCACQYKCLKVFKNMSKSDIKTTKLYFGVRHGKGPCDGVTGRLKQTLKQAVVSRSAVLSTAKDVYTFGKENIEKSFQDGSGHNHNQCHFFYIEKENIVREIVVEKGKTPVIDTRKIHSVRNCGKAGHIMTRLVGCACMECLKEDWHKCLNKKWVNPWKEVDLIVQPKQNRKEAKKGKRIKQTKEETKKAKKERVKMSKEERAKKTVKATIKSSNIKATSVDNGLSSESRSTRSSKLANMNICHSSSPRSKSASIDQRTITRKKKPTKRSEVNLRTTRPSKSASFEEGTCPTSTRKKPRKNKGQSNMTPSEESNKKPSITSDYSEILRNFSKIKHYKALQMNCSKLSLPMFTPDTNHTNTNRTIDEDSVGLVPADIQVKTKKLPVQVLGDGNCLPRSGSMLVSGHENYYEELRVRIIVELVKNEDYYCNETNMRKGLNNEAPKHTTVAYAMYSDHYIPGELLPNSRIKKVFRDEVVGLCQPNPFMGIWQIHSLSSVLGSPIYSVYPDKGNPFVRKHLHRLIEPRTHKNNKTHVIMWSNSRTDMPSQYWVPNHFVPLMSDVAELPVVRVVDDEWKILVPDENCCRVDEVINAEHPLSDDEVTNTDRPLPDDEVTNADRPLSDDGVTNTDRPLSDDEVINTDRPLSEDGVTNTDRPLSDDEVINADRQLRTPVLVALDTVDSSNEMSPSLSRG